MFYLGDGLCRVLSAEGTLLSGLSEDRWLAPLFEKMPRRGNATSSAKSSGAMTAGAM